jgi:serine/threonine-protein kinase RsbW
MRAERADLIGMPTEAQFLMSSDPMSVRDGLQQALDAEPLGLLSNDDRSTAEIVLAEVLNNIVEHAYAIESGTIRLCLSLGDGKLVCRIEDDGRAMPNGAPPAGLLPNAQDLPEGGFGWHLIRTLSSGLQYERQGQTNRLSFSLPAEQSAD